MSDVVPNYEINGEWTDTHGNKRTTLAVWPEDSAEQHSYLFEKVEYERTGRITWEININSEVVGLAFDTREDALKFLYAMINSVGAA